MTKTATALVGVLLAFMLFTALPGTSLAQEHPECSPIGAMWLSIAHPGLGEWCLHGWGPFDNCPQKKFWLGFIPLYGWPGYLQVKSAVDARNGSTNDSLTFD